MEFGDFIRSGRTALGDGSIYERLRRDPAVVVDPFIFHGGLIYDPRFSPTLAAIHREYIDVSRKAGLPMLALTDTWRASADRVARSAHAARDVNADNARFLKTIAAGYGSDGPPIFVGGLIGPKGDAYKPEEA
ncbi:MAG: homocysteine S-methyltransferase family protein, partial [Alphaproteobacteria bacterium]|nr:homocysteine S-methyltransferase family protein [Alphaproteobacteria bacterium]